MDEGTGDISGRDSFCCSGEWLSDGHAVMSVQGELDLATATQCRDVLDGLQDRDAPYHLVVDLSQCTFIDSTGISFLVAAHRRVAAPLRVVAPHEQVRMVLKVTSLDRAFVVHVTKAEALEAMRAHVAERGEGDTE